MLSVTCNCSIVLWLIPCHIPGKEGLGRAVLAYTRKRFLMIRPALSRSANVEPKVERHARYLMQQSEDKPH